MTELSPARAIALHMIANQAAHELALDPDFPGFTGKQIAKMLWPDSPGWDRVTGRAGGGVQGGTMPMIGARIARALVDLGMLSMTTVKEHGHAEYPVFLPSDAGRLWLARFARGEAQLKLRQYKPAGTGGPSRDPKPSISEKQIKDASAQGLSYAEMAEMFGVSEKSVWRARRRAKLTRQPPKPASIGDMKRIRVLAAEGMPANWIAEDIRRPASWVRDQVRGGVDPNWASAWHQIRQKPELLALHREFAPRS